MRVIALYLPQFHVIKENNEWWGEGYTEWMAVRNAKPLFRGHNEPRIPLNNNYYDLSDESAKTWKWQAKLAKEYGVYGFCIYHYWFETGKQLLEKPMEILLNHPEIDLNYCICWANETWTKTWYGLETEVLMEQKYGDVDEWENHYYYLSNFFKDPRYIKIDNKPVINIYHTSEIENLCQMRECWNQLAQKDGFDGVYLVSGNTASKLENRENIVDAYYNMEPGFSLKHRFSKFNTFRYLLRTFWAGTINKLFKKKILERKIDIRSINRCQPIEESASVFPGVSPMWDNTPRRSYKGLSFINASSAEFEKQLRKLSNVVNGRKEDFVYVNAWNEWGEGAYLEPDTINNYKYLEAIKKVVSE